MMRLDRIMLQAAIAAAAKAADAAARRGKNKRASPMAAFPRMALCALMFVVSAMTWSQTWAGEGGDAGFLAEIEDLPLMEGLAEKIDAGSSFDTPAGRFVEAYATGKKQDRRQIEAFYTATLPQLGWSAIGKDTFQRDGETLKIEILGNRPPHTVRYTISPR